MKSCLILLAAMLLVSTLSSSDGEDKLGRVGNDKNVFKRKVVYTKDRIKSAAKAAALGNIIKSSLFPDDSDDDDDEYLDF
ncbi:Hypothetical predicted protein [Podarcis lilfordi]|uniref:Uncharacterized protein n=1 Tax=Podarcis lilfordi TaxID=74358 RepID=A0AA35PF06_9SAUR|nr:Hypothetical predicted protein [Podarcis lilfordi]